MKSIRTADGLVADLRMMLDAPGDYVNYWGEKQPGQYDIPPRGDRWGHLLDSVAQPPPRPIGWCPSQTSSCTELSH
jgi:hypothetical protein